MSPHTADSIGPAGKEPYSCLYTINASPISESVNNVLEPGVPPVPRMRGLDAERTIAAAAVIATIPRGATISVRKEQSMNLIPAFIASLTVKLSGGEGDGEREGVTDIQS